MIKHENGRYWVLESHNCYSVLFDEQYTSPTIRSFPKTEDNLQRAITLCDTLARKDIEA